MSGTWFAGCWYEKKFSGICKQEKQEKQNYTYYVRDLTLEPTLSLDRLYQNLKDENILQETNLGNGKIFSFRANDLIKCGGEMLEEDPYSLVKIKDKRIE